MAEPAYVAIAERRVNPTHAHLGSPAVTSCQILGAFRTAEEGNKCVRDQAGGGFSYLTERTEGGGGPNSWEERDGCLRIFDMDMKILTLNARVERHQLAAPTVQTEAVNKRRRADTAGGAQLVLPPLEVIPADYTFAPILGNRPLPHAAPQHKSIHQMAWGARAPAPETYTFYTTRIKHVLSNGRVGEKSFGFRTPQDANACALSYGAEHGLSGESFRNRNGLLAIEARRVRDGTLWIDTTEETRPVARSLLAMVPQPPPTLPAPQTYSQAMSTQQQTAPAAAFFQAPAMPAPRTQMPLPPHQLASAALALASVPPVAPVAPQAPPSAPVSRFNVKFRLKNWEGHILERETFTYTTAEAANEKALLIAEDYNVCEEEFSDWNDGLLSLEGKKCSEGCLMIDVEKALQPPPPDPNAPAPEVFYAVNFSLRNWKGHILEEKTFNLRTVEVANQKAISIADGYRVDPDNFDKESDGCLSMLGKKCNGGCLNITVTAETRTVPIRARQPVQAQVAAPASDDPMFPTETFYSIKIRVTDWYDNDVENMDYYYRTASGANSKVKLLAAEHGVEESVYFEWENGLASVRDKKVYDGMLKIETAKETLQVDVAATALLARIADEVADRPRPRKKKWPVRARTCDTVRIVAPEKKDILVRKPALEHALPPLEEPRE